MWPRGQARENLEWQVLFELFSVGNSEKSQLSAQKNPSLGDLPKPGIKSSSPALQADSLPTEPPSQGMYF